MAHAQQFSVSFGYGAKDGKYYGPKGSVGPYHRGNDRLCPIGTPVIVNGVQIGLTGNTGKVSGAHLHTQAGLDKACQKDINPYALEFQPGTVVNAGTGPTWGKFVTVQVGSKFITYCHLSQITVNIGRVLAPPQPVGPSKIFLPAYSSGLPNKAWRVYKVGSPNGAPAIGSLNPWRYGGLEYAIIRKDTGAGRWVIRTQILGEVSLPQADAVLK